MIKLGILDKNVLFRESVQHMIESESLISIELSVSSFAECKQKIQPAMVDVLLIDIEGFTDLEYVSLKELSHQFPEVSIAVLSNALSKNYVLKLVSFGINTFYPKTISIDFLSNAIVNLRENQSAASLAIDPDLIASFTQAEKEQLMSSDTENTFFSERELQIIKLVCREDTNVEIAEQLGLSVRTIETHRRRMIDKTHSKTMIGVILYAQSLGVILPNPDKRTLVYTQS